MNIGFIYQVYKNKKATDFVLKHVRKYFDGNITLISDGGDDFSDLSQKYSCTYYKFENIFGNEINKYPIYPYNSHRTKEWWRRHKLACDESKSDYMMLLEDDVYIRKKFEIKKNFDLMGVRFGPRLSEKMKEDIKNSSGINISQYGMCGGSIYNVKTFLKIYDDVIDDIDKNHDKLVQDVEYKIGWSHNSRSDIRSDYFLLGAVDANMTYHFGKRGYEYEHCPWLAETKEDNWHNYPVVHGFKEHY